MKRKIRVLIVDDSSVIRTLLTRLLSSDPEIEVIGTASDPYIAREKLVALKPDVMTLDIEMPRMDGIEFLGKVMQHFPIRTLILSSFSQRNSAVALSALEAGAIDVMAKPAIDLTLGLGVIGKEIIDRVKLVASANLNISGGILKTEMRGKKNLYSNIRSSSPGQVLTIASSTGGPEALKVVLTALPENIPGTLIVQHMPPIFTKTYAESLQKICAFEVKEAEDEESLVAGKVLIAPGNYHMELARSGSQYFVKLHQNPLLHGVRPAADYLMKSVAKYAGAKAIGVVLTGMGRDGAEGLVPMKAQGSFNIAQDERTCVVFGMPKAAIESHAIHKILPLPDIAGEIIVKLRSEK